MPHQKFESATIKPRYSKGRVSVFGINSVYPRIPWIAAWWAAAFPGFGHMYLGKHLRGFVLVIWELVVNNQSNLNLGMILSFQGQLYSFHGDFRQAAATVDWQWFLFLPSIYVFAIYQYFT